MTTITIAGIDPALRNVGLVKGTLDLDSGIFHLASLKLLQTETSKHKQVRKNSDDLERARIAYKGIQEFLVDVDLVCVEIPVGSQSARAMASYGISIGVIASIDKPLIQVTATEVKMNGAGTKLASKVEMINWATTRYPMAPWLTHGGKITQNNEHLADALAAIHAGAKTDEFKLLTAIMNRKN